MGYSPWGRRVDPTERLSTEQHSIEDIHGLLLNKLRIKKKIISSKPNVPRCYMCIGNNKTCRIFLVLSPGWGELFLFILSIWLFSIFCHQYTFL